MNSATSSLPGFNIRPCQHIVAVAAQQLTDASAHVPANGLQHLFVCPPAADEFDPFALLGQQPMPSLSWAYGWQQI